MRRDEQQRFDRELEEILRQLPSHIAARLDEVAVVVEDRPSAEMLAELGMDEHDVLLGLHEGASILEQSVEDSAVLPPQIWLFREPIADEAAELGQPIGQQILITLLHELGHQFGLDEDSLDDLGFA